MSQQRHMDVFSEKISRTPDSGISYGHSTTYERGTCLFAKDAGRCTYMDGGLPAIGLHACMHACIYRSATCQSRESSRLRKQNRTVERIQHLTEQNRTASYVLDTSHRCCFSPTSRETLIRPRQAVQGRQSKAGSPPWQHDNNKTKPLSGSDSSENSLAFPTRQ